VRVVSKSSSAELAADSFGSTCTEDERKLWCQLLPKLHISEESDDLEIKALTLPISELKEVSKFY